MTQKKPKKSLQELTLLNRFLFAEAMEIPENMKIVLDIILEDDILLSDVPQTEKEMRKSTLYRYAKLDVWAKDVSDTVYDTEVQAQDTKNLPKRTRYYQAMIDSRLMEPGDIDFNNLNRSVIIMITPFDLFGYGLYRYTFVGQCLEVPGLKLEDDATRIFLNTRGTNDADVRPELIQLLHYIENTNDRSLEFNNEKLLRLQKNVKSVQDNAEVGVRYMQLWEEFEYERRVARTEGREAGLTEGREIGLTEVFLRAMDKGFSRKEAQELAGIDDEMVKTILAKNKG